MPDARRRPLRVATGRDAFTGNSNCRRARSSRAASVLICSDTEAAHIALMARAKLIKNHLGLALEIHRPPAYRSEKPEKSILPLLFGSLSWATPNASRECWCFVHDCPALREGHDAMGTALRINSGGSAVSNHGCASSVLCGAASVLL